ncbi:IclR family transcriptional regulator [Pseudohoeflea coraliihabitans]|uniref:IclR family transcriptional regulator n=1 Tax=Pseudohoeflea coraliihabitans TaxID=2860393 RepID=A0ABS6WNL1_9HYPH|nr:IclR family transcriptional regulator [Pseudohoeflea sp. DP4N28-3]MBW3097480.1 IclR family transcriptional regulator [Pseudohoeflea sp. DP4N28-3]
MAPREEGTPSTPQTSTKKSAAGAGDRLFVDALARGMSVLEAFADHPEPMSLARIATLTQLDKSGVQRLVHTFVQLGYLEKGPGGVVPGRKLLERSFDYLRSNPLVHRAVPIIADLRRTVKERVDLSLFDDLSMLYVIRMQSKRDTFYAHLIGRRVPTYCTSGGRAVLSHLPDDEVLDLLQRSNRRKLTPHTTTQIDDILRHVEAVRASGYSLAIEEVLVGEIAVAAAVLDGAGRPVGAIHVAGSLAEWQPDEFVSRAGPLVSAAAAGLRQS